MRLDRLLMWVVAASAALGGPQVLDAQSIRMRYEPAVGQRILTLWWFDVTSTVSEGTDGVDDLIVESTGTRSLSHRVIDVRSDQRVLEIRRDSMSVRTKLESGAWVVSADSSGAQTGVRLTMDDRMRVLDVEGLSEGATGYAQLIAFRAFSTGMEFTLPEQSVDVDQTWASDVVLPLHEPTGIEEEPEVSMWLQRVGDLVARGTFTLDSLVDRGTDTLAFLRVHGTFLPTTIASAAEAAEGRARISGSFAGRIIWSTGWSAFVSGGLRTQVHMATFVGTPQDEAPGLSATVDVSSRFQVRR
jgi:hypothetical protein